MPALEPLKVYNPWQARAIRETAAEIAARVAASHELARRQADADAAEYDEWARANPPGKRPKKPFRLKRMNGGR